MPCNDIFPSLRGAVDSDPVAVINDERCLDKKGNTESVFDPPFPAEQLARLPSFSGAMVWTDQTSRSTDDVVVSAPNSGPVPSAGSWFRKDFHHNGILASKFAICGMLLSSAHT